eukprot:UN4327
MHPARREEYAEGRAAEEAPVDPGLLAPIPLLALQVPSALFVALEPQVVLRAVLLARKRRLLLDAPRLPVDLPVQVRSHPVGAPEAIEVRLPRYTRGSGVPPLHLLQDRLSLGPRPLRNLSRPGPGVLPGGPLPSGSSLGFFSHSRYAQGM